MVILIVQIDLDLALWLIQSQLCLQEKFGANQLLPHFRHPNRPSGSAVTGYITNYPQRFTCSSSNEYSVFVDNSTTEITVTSCQGDQPGDKLISKIPIE